jgi:hypothetical protein
MIAEDRVTRGPGEEVYHVIVVKKLDCKKEDNSTRL